MKYVVIGALLAAATVAVVWPDDSEQRVVVKKPYDPNNKNRGGGGGTTILYHGGPVLNGTTTAYVIFYGNFKGTTAAAVITDFLSDINGTAAGNPYEVNEGYDNSSAGTGTFISPAYGFAAADVYYDSYSLGKGTTITSGGVVTILRNAFAAKGLPADANGMYFVLTSPDVSVQGFCHSYCAYHTNASIGGVDIKYALVPDPGQACTGCDGNVAVFRENTTPNGDRGADEMTDSMIHEFSETVTDPDLNAWYTNNGAENGDLCNYNYGPLSGPGSAVFLAPNGAHANFTGPISHRPYLVQWIWKRAGGPCANTP